MEKIGLFYGSTDGNTEKVVKKVQKSMDKINLHSVDHASTDDLKSYSILIFATSTWNTGELQEDWEYFIEELVNVDFQEKMVSFIGVGDSLSYPDTFVDGIGLIYNKIKKSNVKFFGSWPIEDYSFNASLGVIDGKFVGLIIDEDNEQEKTDARIAAWITQIITELKLNQRF